MKAVNLIPREELRAARGGGRSGGGAYAVLAVLALAVVMAAAWAHLGATANDKAATEARVQAEATTAEAKASKLKVYTDFAQLSASRSETVRQLAGSRFDWPHALRDVARTVPASAWVTSLRATVSPNVSVDGTADPLRQAIAVPAIEVTGCAKSQSDVAGTVAAMRQIDDVQRVSLSSSASAGAGAGSSGACGKSAPADAPQFSMTVFFNAPAATATTGATGTAAATASTTPGGTTP
jgi:Tfp pilus assembly protein PilN